MEVARLELQHLEQRFRLRVEHEQSGLPLPPRHEILAAQPPPGVPGMPGIPSILASLQGGTPPPNPWLSSVAPPPGIYSNAPGVAPGANLFGAANPVQAHLAGLAAAPHPQLSQLLLQASNERYAALVFVVPDTLFPRKVNLTSFAYDFCFVQDAT